MSVYQTPSHKDKWYCEKCNTWCMNTSKECPLCSNPKPKNPKPKN